MKHRISRLLAVLLAFVLVLGAMPVASYADETEEQLQAQLEEANKKKEEASNKRQSAQDKVDSLKEEQTYVIEQKMALEERNFAALEEINAIKEEILVYNLKIAIKQKDVDAAAALEEAQLELYRSRVRSMEEGSGYNILAVIFNADSFAEMIAAIDDYHDIMSSDVRVYEELKAARRAHEEIAEEFAGLKEECEEKKAALEADKAELEQQIADSEAQIEELGKQIDAAEEELEAMERAEAAASVSVSNFLAEYLRKKEEAKKPKPTATPAPSSGGGVDAGAETPKPTKAPETTPAPTAAPAGESGGVETTPAPTAAPTATPAPAATPAPTQSAGVEIDIGGDTPAATATPQPAATATPQPEATPAPTPEQAEVTGSGSYTWPFPGHYNITSPFGYRASTGTNHTGIDIDGYQSAGSAIVAADSGTVIFAAYNGGYGNCIMIDHGSAVTVYAHLNFMNVSVGSVVSKGQTIGGVGNTGTCYGLDGVHLHFEVRINGTPVDPQGYV